MGLFDDKKYENMDWISQAVEPIDAPIAELLALLPDELVFDYDMFMKYFGDCFLSLRTITMENYITPALKEQGKKVDYREVGVLAKCFMFQIPEEGIVMNYEDGTMMGEMKLVKIKTSLEEKELLGMMGMKGMEYIDSYGGGDYHRAHEMADLMGCDQDILKSRSVRTKISGIRHRYRTIMTNGQWNIKSAELADKVGFWIGSYIQTGNLAALKNITKLKVMTYRGLPIYSIEEE